MNMSCWPSCGTTTPRQDDDDDDNKRIRCVTDDLICPLTMALPFDPVIAEDGRIYERQAIEDYMEQCKNYCNRRHNSSNSSTTNDDSNNNNSNGDANNSSSNNNNTLKSPGTNQIMGARLLPSPQTKQLIEKLIASGVITNPTLLRAWGEKLKQQAYKEQLLLKAENGNAQAMGLVGYHHVLGKFCFRKDRQLARHWLERGHDAGDVLATRGLGEMLLVDSRQEKDNDNTATAAAGEGGGSGGGSNTGTQGIFYMALAAERGSARAAFVLGVSFAKGRYGLPVKPTEARKWLRKCLAFSTAATCTDGELSNDKKQEAQRQLELLEKKMTADSKE